MYVLVTIPSKYIRVFLNRYIQYCKKLVDAELIKLIPDRPLALPKIIYVEYFAHKTGLRKKKQQLIFKFIFLKIF